MKMLGMRESLINNGMWGSVSRSRTGSWGGQYGRRSEWDETGRAKK